MALISCPECNQEISDQTKSCPHCGYPIKGEEKSASSQALEITGPNISKARNIKKIVWVLLGVAVVIVVSFFAYTTVKTKQLEAIRTEYIGNLKAMNASMLAGAIEAEDLGNLARAVWYNTIYEKKSPETDPYTVIPNAKGPFFSSFNADFNDSLRALFAADSTAEQVKSIQANQAVVQNYYIMLQNAPEDLAKHYELMEAAFSNYQKLTDLAISPAGSLASYTENFGKYDTDFVAYYEKLNLLLPDA